MQINQYRNISDISHLWIKLYRDNKALSWFQSFEWYQLVEKSFKGQKWTKFLFSEIIYFVIDEVVIIPIVKNRCRKLYYLLGEDTCSDYLSVIYDASMKESELRDCVSMFLNSCAGYCVRFDRINERTMLSHVLTVLSENISNKIVEKDCIYIPVSDKMTFYDTLSKNARQNYRTAKNRLTKDGYTYSIECKYGAIEADKTTEMYNVYNERRENCSDTNPIILLFRKILKKLVSSLHIEKRFDLITEYNKIMPVVYSCIYIDDVLSAYYCGQYNNDGKSVSISRVATNPKFYKYSPGQILFVETIDSFTNKQEVFDLTRGQEDYKFKLGGVVHHNYMFSFVL